MHNCYLLILTSIFLFLMTVIFYPRLVKKKKLFMTVFFFNYRKDSRILQSAAEILPT